VASRHTVVVKLSIQPCALHEFPLDDRYEQRSGAFGSPRGVSRLGALKVRCVHDGGHDQVQSLPQKTSFEPFSGTEQDPLSRPRDALPNLSGRVVATRPCDPSSAAARQIIRRLGSGGRGRDRRRSYDAEWPRRFEAERATLERVLSPWLHGGIEHIGSTAIPGISAKPIIDMIAAVRELDEARAAYEPLAAEGYISEPHRPEIAHHFAKPALELGVRTFGLHLTQPSSSLWRERIAFRDALRADPALAADYEAMKLRLACEHSADLEAYTNGKREFVHRVLVGAETEFEWR
jgi:GrpB-like predicted nucleotidyltransferase (UPF0157 family)